MISILLGNFAAGVIVGLFTYIALRLATWLIRTAVYAIAGLIRKIKEKVAIIRKRKAMEAMLATMAKELAKVTDKDTAEKDAIMDALTNLKRLSEDQGAAFVTPMDDEGHEHWEKVKVVLADDNQQDNTPDRCIVTEDERWSEVRV